MPVALWRVDDRLVHGQVVIGWGRPLKARLIVLVDNAVRESAWEQDLYRMALPDDVELVVVSLDEARGGLAGWAADPRPVIVLTADLSTMAALHAAAPTLVTQINLGGLHHQTGRHERLRYIYLTDGDEALLKGLEGEGVRITAQDLPTTPAVALARLVA